MSRESGSETGRWRFAGFAVVSVVHEGDAPDAVRLVFNRSVEIAIRLVLADPEAVVVAVIVGDAGRPIGAIDIPSTALESTIATG